MRIRRGNSPIFAQGRGFRRGKGKGHGMRLRMRVHTPPGRGRFSSIDGSDKTSVSAFQSWANQKYGANLAVDGIFGPKSKAAFEKWGAEWEKTASTSKPKARPVPQEVAPSAPAAETVKLESPDKKGFVEKIKAMPMPAKIAIGVGVLALVGVVIWKSIPKKK